MDSGGDLKITITGVNKASKVFDAVVDSAEKLGPALDDATGGAKRLKPAADEAVRAIDPLPEKLDETGRAATESGQAIDRSAKSFSTYKGAATDAVAGLALLGTAFTMYAGQARDHEVTVLALRRIYGEAADSYIAFADTIQSTTIFSNDEALAAARMMGTLRENYDLTDQQIQQLISTSADLATMHGLTLTDASQRVAAAIRGEAESAEALGLTMNQAAIDSEGLTLSMTNGEAAAFRYDALMKQSASSMGVAAEAADTTAGKTKQLANEFQDAMMSVVEFTGPVGEAAASLGSFGIEAGIAVGGLAQVAKGIQGLKAAGGLATLATFLTGPGGIVLGLGAAAAATWLLVDALGGDGGASGLSASFISARDTVTDLNDEVNRLTAGLSDAVLALDIFEGQASFQPMIDELEELNRLWQLFGDPDTFNAASQPEIFIDENGVAQVVEQTAEAIAEQEANLQRLRDLMARYGGSADEALGQVEEAMADWATIIGHHGAGAEQALQAAADAWNVFEASAKTDADFVALTTTLDGIANGLGELDEAALKVAATQQALATASQNTTTATSEQARSADVLTDAYVAQEVAMAKALQTQWRIYEQQRAQALAGLTSGAEPAAADVVGVNNPMLLRRVTMGLDQISAAAIRAAFDLKTVNLPPSLSEDIDQATRATVDFDAALGQLVSDRKPEIEVMETAYRELADAAAESFEGMNANSVLGGNMQSVVGAAQGFANLSESVWDWSNSLTEGITGSSKLDQLLLNGQISGKTYREGLEANHRIMLANNDVQEDSLRIQAKQLPLMAQLAEEQAAYVDGIADMSAEQQLVALGFMDTTKTAQALQLAQLAAASSTDAMQASTTALLLEAAKADPQLKAMLISMGLISETDTGIKVNFGDVTSAEKGINLLNSTLATLTAVIAEAFGINVKLDDGGAEARLGSILARLNEIDGRVVTSYVQTIGLNSDALSRAGGAMHGGVIGKYAGGGVVAEMGEAGPELFRVPSGLWQVAPTHSYYNVPHGTSVLPAPATRDILDKARGGSGGATYNGPVYQTVRVDDSRFARRAHDLRRSRG